MPIPKSPTGEMPFFDHLEELRWRIIYSLVGLVAGLVVGLILVFKFDVLRLIERPLAPFHQQLVYTHPADPFNILIQLAFTIAIVLALPVVVYQLWAFLSPALHKHEKRLAIPVLVAATVLFLCGVSMAWFLVMPMTLKFFFGLGVRSLTPMITVEEYFSFVTSMCLAFGGVFEVPILIVGLTALGIITPKMLSKFRRYAIALTWLVSALITPGDLITTTLALAVPLYLLYELSAVASLIVYKRRQRREAAYAAGHTGVLA